MAETEEIYELLCERLDGVLPEKMLALLKGVEPKEAAVALMLDSGGRLLLREPSIDLVTPYEYPPEVKELEDSINGFTFKLPYNGIDVLTMAASVGQNVDDVVETSFGFAECFPIAIVKRDRLVNAFVIDTERRELEIPLGRGNRMDISASETLSEEETVKKKALAQLSQVLDDFKTALEGEPKAADETDEEAALDAWLEKHSYDRMLVMNMSVSVTIDDQSD